MRSGSTWILLALCWAIGSCHPAGPESCPSDLSGPMAKRSSTEHGERSSISLEDLFLKHQSGQVVVIDARHPWFFHRGHIAGATNVPSDEEFEPDALIAARLEKWKSAIAEGKTLVVYCDGLLCSDARTVSRAISKQGLDVSVFGGGWEAWKKANLPIESTSQEP